MKADCVRKLWYSPAQLLYFSLTCLQYSLNRCLRETKAVRTINPKMFKCICWSNHVIKLIIPTVLSVISLSGKIYRLPTFLHRQVLLVCFFKCLWFFKPFKFPQMFLCKDGFCDLHLFIDLKFLFWENLEGKQCRIRWWQMLMRTTVGSQCHQTDPDYRNSHPIKMIT